MSDIKEQLGYRVKALRKSAKITQADLAAFVDVDIRTIRRIESGAYNPSLNISVSELFK
jgi:DNA-binding XRE family transcriptional regulator